MFGLRLLGHRYYDPSTGRFLTRDPIKDGRNWYAYCGNDPLSNLDPSGLSHDAFDHFLENSTNFFAGWGHALTGGTIEYVWAALGVSDVVDRNSGTFTAGSYLGEVHGFFLPTPGKAKLAAQTTSKAWNSKEELYSIAQAMYPKKAGKHEWHHVLPIYLGGEKKGEVVWVPAAVHQMITNKWRQEFPYGVKGNRGQRDNPKVHDFMERIRKDYFLGEW